MKTDKLHPVLTLPEIVQSAAKTGKRVYIISVWGRWELDAFWSDKDAFAYYLDHYDDKFQYIAGNADYISLQRKD